MPPKRLTPRQQSIEFLKLLDPNATSYTFQTFREKGSTANIVPKIMQPAAFAELEHEHDLGAGIYVTVNETDLKGRGSGNIIRVRTVWQEDDSGHGGPFPLEPSMVVETSPGHFHRYWLASDEWPADEQGRADFTAVMQRMVESYGSDKNATDISRVLRVPGFLHRKGKPYMARLIEDNGRRYTRAEIVAAFPKVERDKKQTPHKEWKPQDNEDQRIRDALHSINTDERNVWLQCGMALKDYYGDSGRSLWDEWSRKSPHYDERGLDKTWRSFKREGITIGTVFYYAKQAGWKEERVRGRDEERNSNDTVPPSNQASEKIEPWQEGMITARELCSMRFTPLKLIVPRIIPEGLTILAGRPKIGKSWLVLLLGVVLANGVAALGLDYGLTKPLKGSVLYLGLEDGRRRLQRRMTKLIGSALPENWPEQLYLKTDWRRLDQGGLDDIRAWYESAKAKGETPILVVVDTLAKVRAPGTSKTSPYQNDHDALAGLQKLAEELGIAVVVNHHDRKMDADDVFDTVSGTLGLTGAVDTILVLTRKAQGTTLHIRGRDIEDETDLAMQFNKESCRWSVLGSASEVHRSKEQKRILDALANAPSGLPVKEIMAGADMHNRNAVDILLFKMATAGDIEKVSRGIYGLPGTAKVEANSRGSGKIGKKERSTEQATESKEEDDENQSFRNLSAQQEAERFTAPPQNDCPLIFPIFPEPSIDGKIVKSLDTLENKLNLSDLSDLSAPPEAASVMPPPDKASGPVHHINGWNISRGVEHREPQKPGELSCFVKIREIRHPAIKSGPDDDLDDFVAI